VTFDELMKHAATEAPRVEEREVSVADQELVDELVQRGGMPLVEYISDPRRKVERRTFRRAHLFGPPASPDQLDQWKRRWPKHRLPADLEALLMRANGIHLWADAATGRSYEGLAPLEEWELARTKMWGPRAKPEDLADEYLAISYITDRSAFVVLKVTTGEYFLMDACGADEKCRIGDDVGALLDWLWRYRIA
jgi:hypothetical protein